MSNAEFNEAEHEREIEALEAGHKREVEHLLDRVRVLTVAVGDTLEIGNEDIADHLARLRMLDRLRRALTSSAEPGDVGRMQAGETQAGRPDKAFWTLPTPSPGNADSDETVTLRDRVRVLEEALRRHRNGMAAVRHTLTPIQQDALAAVIADINHTLAYEKP